jgi:hypothetical protein
VWGIILIGKREERIKLQQVGMGDNIIIDNKEIFFENMDLIYLFVYSDSPVP